MDSSGPATDPSDRGGELYTPRFVRFGSPARRPLLARTYDQRAIDILWEVSESENSKEELVLEAFREVKRDLSGSAMAAAGSPLAPQPGSPPSGGLSTFTSPGFSQGTVSGPARDRRRYRSLLAEMPLEVLFDLGFGPRYPLATKWLSTIRG